jgi:DNA-binding NarL/FixJ family response regulator
VVLLAGDLAPAASVRLLRAGVRAILPRDACAPEIAAGIEAVAEGLIVLHPSAAPISVSQSKRARGARDETGTDPLTPRELEILTMMAEGMGNRTIAQRLGISIHTVKFHIAAILDKLSARSRTEAVTIGLRLGLLMV